MVNLFWNYRMKRLLFLFFLCFSILGLHAQAYEKGMIRVKNFSSVENGFGAWNYAIAQDLRGIMYFGNNDDGVLEYDGINWRKIAVPKGIVWSLTTDNIGRVFVGSDGDFGMLVPDHGGQLRYRSLYETMHNPKPQFSQVLSVRCNHDKVYFCSRSNLFIYNYDSVQVFTYPDKSDVYLSFLIQDTLYLGSDGMGILTFDGKTFHPTPGGKFFAGKTIQGILPFKENNQLVILNDSVFVYNPATGKISGNFLAKNVIAYLKGSNIYSTYTLPQQMTALGTQEKGVVIIDSRGCMVNVLNKSVRLQDDGITGLFMKEERDRQNPLWMSLTSGVSEAQLFSPIRILGEEQGIEGEINDVVRFKGTVYIVAGQRVYYLEGENTIKPRFVAFKDIISPWNFYRMNQGAADKEKLLVSTDYGIYEITGPGRSVSLSKKFGMPSFRCRGLFASPTSANRVFVCGLDGFNSISLDGNRWRHDPLPIRKINHIETRTAVEDNTGDIWLGTYTYGIIRVSFHGNDTLVRIFGLEDGLPTLRDDNVYMVNGRLVFATPGGVYRYDEKADRIVPDTAMGSEWSDGSKGVFNFVRVSSSQYLTICVQGSQAWVEKLYFTGSNPHPRIVTSPFKPLTRRMIYSAFQDENGVVWIGVGNELYTIDERSSFNYNATFPALIRKVTIGKDSVLFGGYFYTEGATQPMFFPRNQQMEKAIPEISFFNNNLLFEFSASYYDRNEDIRYSYYLDGYKDYWSAWSAEPKASFNNLSPGHYVFKVKARNVYGAESETAIYAFTILPPWYRTVLAYIIYVILAVVLVWGIVKFNTRRLQLEKIRLEGIVQERTAEILKQKKEIEIQRDQIAAQKKDITDSIVYASRIQQAVLPSEKILNEQLPDHFILFKPRDIVSGDFYWMSQKGHRIYVVAADCTGHGVPGAFMSMLGMSFLNEIVIKSDVEEAGMILNELREHVITQLKQKGEAITETKDGMDIALVIIDRKKNLIQFSGANNPMYIVRPLTEDEKANPVDEAELPRGYLRSATHELIQINADKMPIGISANLGKPFTQADLKIVHGNSIYILSDGYEDQFGGPQGKKFLSKAFKRLLLQIQDKSMQEQKLILDKTIEEWKGDLEQVDDILVMGFKI